MPNWCENDLYIKGPSDQVAALLAAVGADKLPPNFDFEAVLPYPPKFGLLTDVDGFNNGGYDWCVENWGTKWPASDVARRDYDGVCVSFKTAWSPPTPVVKALHKQFPQCTITLEFFECGNAFCGGFSCSSKEDWYAEEPWEPGRLEGEWQSPYGGHRGG